MSDQPTKYGATGPWILTLDPEQKKHVEALLKAGLCVIDRNAVLEAFGTKVNAVRNSIIGMQGFNWSEHAYPLVAALDEAGFEGAAYPETRANLGTLIEQRDAAQKRVAELDGPEYDAANKFMAALTATRAERNGK